MKSNSLTAMAIAAISALTFSACSTTNPTTTTAATSVEATTPVVTEATELTAAQQAPYYADDIVRLSRIEIAPNRIDEYKAFLKEEAETSVRIELGVRVLYAAFEKEKPHHLTILEIYDSPEAYKSHIASPHFIKYKEGTLDMVTKLELIDCDPLSPQMPLKAPAALQQTAQ